MKNSHINLIYGLFLLVGGGLTRYVNPWLGVLVAFGAFIWALEAKGRKTLEKWSFPLYIVTLGLLPFFLSKRG